MDNNILKDKKHIHFIGIGGSGMYPLAQILHTQGYFLTGSDNNETETLDAVRKMGIPVFIGQRAENIEGADLIVHTAAIMEDNHEEAIRREIVVGLPKNTRWREVPDRRQAIEQTIAMMRQGDLLLLAGKGHEDYQIIQNKTIPFDEREIVTEILKSGRIPWKNCHCEK